MSYSRYRGTATATAADGGHCARGDPGQATRGQRQGHRGHRASATRSCQQEPDTSQPAEDSWCLARTGEAAAEDGSVAPIIGGLPAVEGSGLGYRHPPG